MSGETERFQMLAPRSWLGRVDDWRFANRISSRSNAVRQLVERGLEAEREATTGPKFGDQNPVEAGNINGNI